MKSSLRLHLRALAPVLLLTASSAAAQDTRVTTASTSATVTAADYARAERFLGWNAAPLVYRANVRPTWLPDERFWYRNTIPEGHKFILVDPARGTRRPAFDHARLARALSAAADTNYTPYRLPFTTFELSADGRSITFDAAGRRWTCELDAERCTAVTRPGPPTGAGPAAARRDAIPSPDGRLAAFIRDHDLWVVDLETGRETRLTTDGEKDYGYATDNQGWSRSDRPVLLWSPDSRKIATFRLDERGVEEMHLLETREGRPALHSWKYALPGDSVVPMMERVVIHLDGPRVVRLQAEPDHQRASGCCGIKRGDALADVEWSADATRLAYVSTSRDYKHVRLRIADPETGEVRTVLEETGEPFFESSAAGRGNPNWRVLHASNEIIWFSQRDGWGHLYLYDLRNGRLKNRITSGEWNVLEILHVDEDGRWIYFTGVGREPGRDPYLRHLYRVRFDGKRLTLLTPEDADHDVTISPSGRYIIDTWSRVDQPPVTTLRRADGRVITTLETAEIDRLLETGWTPPTPFTVKARDGETDLHGLMFRPTDFDPAKSYPIIVSIYPGPQTGSVGTRSFSAARGDARALAELGFVVVQIDALGTPMRSREFHATYYGDMGDNGLEDQIAGVRQLAERFPWIDLGRVGIYGHSGGGFAAAGAILRYPDFFHVAVATAGNHDNRGYTYYWGEKWQGLLRKHEDGTDSYTNQANHLLAGNLKGRLLLAYGTMDSNVHPNMTLLLVDELIRHNKDFDLIVMPNRGHGFSMEPYMIRRRWDYFVQHLLGAEPPREYELRRPGAPAT